MTTETMPDVEEPITYSSVDLMHLGGATYRQVDYWCKRGWLPDTAHGSGSQRTFSADDLAFVRYTVALLGHDIALSRAAQLARLLVAGFEVKHTVGEVELTVRPIPTSQEATQ